MKQDTRKEPELTVSAAIEADIPGILAVLEENLMANKKQSPVASLEQSGFLMTRHSAAHLLAWMEDKKNHLVLVCKRAGEVVGYLLSCDWTWAPPGLREQFKEIEPLKDVLRDSPLLYHKQIAIQPGQKGVGNALIRHFFEAARQKGYHHIACIIVHEPVLNKVSVAFHQKHGFECIGRVHVDEMRDGVYLKKME